MNCFYVLPPALQSFAASARGYNLRGWRYGPETEQLVNEALERESWSAIKWKEWQDERLAEMLEWSGRTVPYYRSIWDRRRRNGDRRSVSDLTNWPVLDKHTVRSHAAGFLAEGYRGRLLRESTSGTTGTPLTLSFSLEAVRAWYALFEARWRRWNGVSFNDHWAIFGGRTIAPPGKSSPPYWVWNHAFKQLYCSSYHISASTVEVFAQALKEYEVRYLYGYASALYSLSRLALEQSVRLPKMSAVISNAEPLYSHQREIIGRAFDSPVKDTYGQSESVCGASECAHGVMHLWPDAGVTEVVGDGIGGRAASAGRIVCTTLLNKAMPLIRYQVGDWGQLSQDFSQCACGRTLPQLLSIEGREDDLLVTTDGRLVGRLDPVFKADLRVREAQIIQEDLDKVRVLVVPEEGFGENDRKMISRGLLDRLGDVTVHFELVPEIPRTSNGKFKTVISKIDRRR